MAKFLRISKAAKMLKINTQMLRRWCRMGLIKCYAVPSNSRQKIGWRWFDIEDVLELKKRMAEPINK